MIKLPLLIKSTTQKNNQVPEISLILKINTIPECLPNNKYIYKIVPTNLHMNSIT